MGNLLQQCNGSDLSEGARSAMLTSCQRYAVSVEIEALPDKDSAANEHANVCGKRIDERAENLDRRALASLADRSKLPWRRCHTRRRDPTRIATFRPHLELMMELM